MATFTKASSTDSAHKPDTDSPVEDAVRLKEMGYNQELVRALTKWTTFGVGFSMINVPGAIFTLLYFGLAAGGPRGILTAWPIVSFFSLLVALSLGEILSAYPTSGGLYYWAAQLAGPKHGAFAGWVTGWFTWIGLIGVSAGSAFAFAEILTALIYAAPTGITPLPHGQELSSLRYKLLCVGGCIFVLVSVAILNSFGIRRLHIASWLWIPFNLSVTIIISAACPIGAAVKGMPMISLKELYGIWHNSTGLPDSWAACIGVLMPCFLYVGHDAPAHMSEESKDAATSGSIAIVAAVLWGWFGWFTLWGVLSVIPVEDYHQLIYEPHTTVAGVDVWVRAVGGAGAVGLGVLLLVVQWTTMVSALAAQARVTYAFARDNALPFSKLWSRLTTTSRIPMNALWLITILNILLILPVFGSLTAYSALASIGTVAQYIGYSVPIFLRVMHCRHFPVGKFHLGPFGVVIGVVSCIWLWFSSILLLLPTKQIQPINGVRDGQYWQDLWKRLNYAPIMVGAAMIFVVGWWIVDARNWFEGPKFDVKTARTFAGQAGVERATRRSSRVDTDVAGGFGNAKPSSR